MEKNQDQPAPAHVPPTQLNFAAAVKKPHMVPPYVRPPAEDPPNESTYEYTFIRTPGSDDLTPQFFARLLQQNGITPEVIG